MGNGGVERQPAVPANVAGVHDGDAADVRPLCLEAGRKLLHLHQGHNTVSDFAIDFQTLATGSGWEGRALVDAFLHGLAEPVKDELLTQDLPDDLERIIAMAICVDARLEDRRRATRTRSPPP